MKRIILALILPLAVVSGLVFANRESERETKRSPKTTSTVNKKVVRDDKKKWEASPDGIKYKAWEISPAGKKVHASYDKIKKSIKAFTSMEATVTSVTFKRTGDNSKGPKWLIVRINDDDYMMQFIPKDFERLNSLKVNNKIIVKSRSAGYSPNHPYLIITGDYIAKNNKVLLKRDLSKIKGC